MSNRNPEVDSWLANYANPQRGLMAKVREFIMDVSPELSEAALEAVILGWIRDHH